MSRVDLVKAYITALPGTVVSVIASADGQRSRFETGEVSAGEIVHARLRFKASHAELVLMTCDVGVDGWADMPPAELLELLTTTAAGLGARLKTDAEITAEAKEVVAVVERHVVVLNANGGLKPRNAAYKRYRLAMQAAGKPAMIYSTYLGKFTEQMVREVAERDQ